MSTAVECIASVGPGTTALLTMVMLIGSGATGLWEKAVLGAVAVAMYALAVPVHAIGSRRT